MSNNILEQYSPTLLDRKWLSPPKESNPDLLNMYNTAAYNELYLLFVPY